MSDAAATDTPKPREGTPWARIARDGLWDNNVVLAQLLALCPLLAVTGTATNGLGMGLASTAVLVVLGGVREIIGSGTLFAGASQFLGPAFGFLEITLIPDYRGFLIAILPPGGFLALGFLLAGKRILDRRAAHRRAIAQARAAAPA
jgi:electron transport complex protein RnfE